MEQIRNDFNITYTQLSNLSGTEIVDFLRLSEPGITPKKEKHAFFYEKRFQNDRLLVASNQNFFENQYKPQFVAFGNSGLNAVEFRNVERRIDLVIGVALTIPNYDGKQRKITEQQTDLYYESLHFYKTQREIELKNNMESHKAQITIYEESLDQMDGQLKNEQNILEIY